MAKPKKPLQPVLKAYVASLRAAASRGERSAIVALLAHDVRGFGDAQPLAAIADARDVVLAAAKRRSLSGSEQAKAEAAEKFLNDIAAAITKVPDDYRTMSMLRHCAAEAARVRAAKQIIIATPRRERHRPSTIDRLTEQTNLPRDMVVRFLQKPRTGVLDVARELTGKKFGVTGEHVRKLGEDHPEYVKTAELKLSGSRRRT